MHIPCATKLYNLSAMDSSTLNSSAMDSSTLNSSAMDLSTISVGDVVLVGKCMQGPR